MKPHLFASLVLVVAAPAAADGLVAQVISSPLSAAGTVKGAPTGINVYFQSEDAQGSAFFAPEIPGYGIPAGGRVEIEMGDGFERVPDAEIAPPTATLVSGAPQQGLPGSALGYAVNEGNAPNVIALVPESPEGLPVESLVPPAPGAQDDPIVNQGFKVAHVGLIKSAFRNAGDSGTVTVRILDGDGSVVHEGSGTVDFLDAPVPQIFPNNFPDAGRNHNWQPLTPGETLGIAEGTVPIAYNTTAVPTGDPATFVTFADPRIGLGLLSLAQLEAMEFDVPAEFADFTAGLFLEDTDSSGHLDPNADTIIGGAMIEAPDGATGYDIRSLQVHGATDLTRPSAAYHPVFGPIFGGAVGLLQFTAGNMPGIYHPTVALLADPSEPSAGISSSYTYTVRVK